MRITLRLSLSYLLPAVRSKGPSFHEKKWKNSKVSYKEILGPIFVSIFIFIILRGKIMKKSIF